MSRLVQEELAASGVAPVLCVLEDSAAKDASRTISKLEENFVASELSQQSALAMAASGEESEAVELPPAVRYYPNLRLAYGTVTREGLAALNRDDRVSEVSGAPPLRPIRPTRVAAAQLTQRLTWGLRALRVEELWKQGLSGAGVLVGHLDTGVDGRHRAVKPAIKHFARFDLLGRKVKPAPKPHDTADHGTHTAATIAGRQMGKKRHVGVAPGAKLASAVVIEGGDVVARVLGGMDWAVGRGVRVLSMSLGFPGMWGDFRPLTAVLRKRNILPVFAVGNEGPGTSRSPGNYGITLSVGANDAGRRVAWFSSSQRFKRKTDPLVPDLVAPGVNVVSARPGRGYQAMDGTSMATPHIAGLAALLIEAKRGTDVAELERAILASCKRSAHMAPGRANRGMPDAVRALKELTGS
jgi:subtilisin family serine protease